MNGNRAFYIGIGMVVLLSTIVLGWLATKSSIQEQLDRSITQFFSENTDASNSTSNPVLGTTVTEDEANDVVPNISVNQLYLLINAHRKDYRLSSLVTHPALEKSAQKKIDDMVENNYYRHQDVENIESWYLFKQVGYHFSHAGENLSFNNNTPWQVFDSWVNSPAHNEQLLGPVYRDMGAAVDCETFLEYDGGGCIVVLHLGAE
jgi:uncharacterized protein YkwD